MKSLTMKSFKEIGLLNSKDYFILFLFWKSAQLMSTFERKIRPFDAKAFKYNTFFLQNPGLMIAIFF